MFLFLIPLRSIYTKCNLKIIRRGSSAYSFSSFCKIYEFGDTSLCHTTADILLRVAKVTIFTARRYG